MLTTSPLVSEGWWLRFAAPYSVIITEDLKSQLREVIPATDVSNHLIPKTLRYFDAGCELFYSSCIPPIQM